MARLWALLLVATSFLLAAPRPARPQQSPAVAPAALPDAKGVFLDIVTRYYQACSRKDLEAVQSLWHPDGPARHARNLLEVEFERQSLALVGVLLRQVTVDAGGGRARAIVDLDVTDAKTKQTRRERRVREFTFLPSGQTWKIWNEGAGGAGLQLASRLLAAPPDERAALIAADAEVRSDDALAGLGLQINRLRSEGRFGDVLDALRLQAELARAIGNRTVLAASLLDAGLVHHVQGRQEEAGRAFAEARALLLQVGTAREVAVVDGNLGAVDYLRADYASAAERYRGALAVFEAEHEDQRAASTLHGLGNALYMLGDFEQAMASYERSLALQEKAANKRGASSVLQALALVHKELGNYAAAVDAYARSAAGCAEATDIVGQAQAEHGLGDVYKLAGDYPRALQHFGASLALWEKTPDVPSRTGTLWAAGQVHALQRQFARAIERYQSALDLDQKIDERPGVARDLGALGSAHFATGRLDLALEEYQKSLALREQLKDAGGVMWTLVHLGVLQTALAQHSEALQAYQRALTMAEGQGDAGAVCTILALRAANELVRDDVEAALASAGKASEMAQRLELFDALAHSRVTAGKALRQAGRPDEAETAFDEAVAALERVPVGPGLETFFDDRRGPYLAMIDLLVSRKRLAEAFEWSERARTRGLAALLGGDGSAVVKGLSADERDQERRFAGDEKALSLKLRRERGREKPDPDRVAAIRTEIDRVHSERTAFRRTLLGKHPTLAVLRAQAAPATVEDAARLLSPSEALLSFVVSDTRTYVFVGNRATVTQPHHLLDAATIEIKATDLAWRVAAMREAIVKREARAPALAQDLYALLLEPVRDYLTSARSLVIVPDAALWSLPFEALRSPTGRYLVQDFAVSYAPSLTALLAMRAAPREDAVRTPPAPGNEQRAVVAAADPAIAPAALDRLTLLGATGTTASQSGVREVTMISRALGLRASRTFLRERPRADRLGAALTAGAGLHLAVPVCLSDASPLHSLIAMSPAGGDNEGVTELVDVMSWTLPAAFVLLPRLEPGAAATGGDALAALSWSLLVAGSPTTIANRWPTADGGTKLTVPFYRAWLSRAPGRPSGATAAEALQKAARGLIAQPGTHLADWTGLMVIGR